jgi:C_GCAxxG_C_C family probable redox protein
MMGIYHEDVNKDAGAYGGGLAGHGEVCGALVGALGILGLRFSRSKKEEKVDHRLWSDSRKLMKHF